MKPRNIVWQLSCLLAAAMFAAIHSYGEEKPDMTNPGWILRESQRIREQHKSDPVRLAAELEAFNEKVSRALGTDRMIERRKKLYDKYGPVSHTSETLPAHGDDPITIDHDAWRYSIEHANHEVKISLFLDKKRYHEARPTSLNVQLRRKGGEHESIIDRWKTTENSFAIDLSYRLTPEGYFQVKVLIPERERNQYQIQLYAEIETGWHTEAVFSLK